MFQRILVPTDGSDLAAAAAQAAIAFAKVCGSEIVALSVVQPEPAVPMGEAVAAIGMPGPDVPMEQAQLHVARVSEAAAEAGVKCTTVTCFGYAPADEIVDAVKRTGCDLIFMASHGRRGLSRLIAGSVTQRVLAYAPVPVMVYRPQPASGKAAG
ncbi:universal stress protein [Massilia jejuensis]|uniref:Universal stress protein n=1 Tax=Massilia jejuensis TaxID=648894 RepID=A0ABW0PFI3_9BURK